MEDKLNAVYALSLHQFDKMTSQMSDLLDEHNVKVIQCRELKSKAQSLEGECNLLSLRCSNILKEKTGLDESLADALEKYKDLEGRNGMIFKEKMNLLASFKKKLDMQTQG